MCIVDWIFAHSMFRFVVQATIITFLVGVFIAKDIALLLININNDCNDALETYGESKFVSFGLKEWILTGSIVHIVLAAFFVTQFLIASFYVFQAQVPEFDFNINDYLGISVCYCCFFIPWTVIGFFLHSEMNAYTKLNQQCSDIVLAWSIIQMIEPCFLFRWLYVHWDDDDDD
eukprot:407130_1